MFQTQHVPDALGSSAVVAAATVYVTALEPMCAFYEGCFGLTLVDFAAGEYCLLESDAWTLALERCALI
jgi:hypothetical protein